MLRSVRRISPSTFCFGLLVERVRLHLIDHRADASKGAEIYQTVRVEVGNADGTNFTGFIRSIAELQDAVAYIDWKQGFYDDVLSGKTEYYSNLVPERRKK